jgi:hypothetical protein
MSKRGPINYDIEVWCHKCGEKHSKTDCEFRPRFGWKCPWCGNKCRSKPINTSNKSYIPSKTKHNIRRQILEQKPGYTRTSPKKKEYNKQYNLNHREYFRQYRINRLAQERKRLVQNC